jgi:hypothetical protein
MDCRVVYDVEEAIKDADVVICYGFSMNDKEKQCFPALLNIQTFSA